MATDEEIIEIMAQAIQHDIIRVSDRDLRGMDDNDPWFVEIKTDGYDHAKAVLAAFRAAGLAVVQDWKQIEWEEDDFRIPSNVEMQRDVLLLRKTPDGLVQAEGWWDAVECPVGFYIHGDPDTEEQIGPLDPPPTHWAPLLPPPPEKEGSSE